MLRNEVSAWLALFQKSCARFVVPNCSRLCSGSSLCFRPAIARQSSGLPSTEYRCTVAVYRSRAAKILLTYAEQLAENCLTWLDIAPEICAWRVARVLCSQQLGLLAAFLSVTCVERRMHVYCAHAFAIPLSCSCCSPSTACILRRACTSCFTMCQNTAASAPMTACSRWTTRRYLKILHTCNRWIS